MAVSSKHLLFAVLQIWALFLTILVHSQEQEGFISIDCGTSKSRYTDEQSGITYLSDTNLVESGENREILSTYKAETDEQQFWNVRSFPEGTRNCYNVEPSDDEGSRYLIRARFMYGNYDKKNKPPTFDLYIGVDLWKTVKIDNAEEIVTEEVLHIPSSNKIQVCLVNTNNGVPFISVLELRPLGSKAYKSQIASLVLFRRFNFGPVTNQIMRFKDDVYDRLWSGLIADAWIPQNISLGERNVLENNFKLPFEVISTGYTKNRSATFMQLGWNDLNASTMFYFSMHFCELEKLDTNQSREFNVYSNSGERWYGPFSPTYLSTITVFSEGSTKPDSDGKLTLWFNKTENSTLPPLINALEVYSLLDNPGKETYTADVNAIFNIKSEYDLKIENWQGDPCSPQAYLWDGLSCTYNDDLPPRITSLNLSSSGLKGEISSYIADMTMDLSNNSLSGTLPEFLAKLSYLRVLNLKGNNLEGPVPPALLGRTDLYLSVDDALMGNGTAPPSSNEASSSTGLSFRDNKFVVPIFASLSAIFINFAL